MEQPSANAMARVTLLKERNRSRNFDDNFDAE